MENNIVNWAEKESGIHAVILTGSRATKHHYDSLSDYDLSVFCENFEPYTEDDAWISILGKVWVWIPEHLEFEGKSYPTRLVIYEGGVKVDFAFYSMEVFKELCKKTVLPPDYDRGYKVLIDKTGKTDAMAEPSFQGDRVSLPSEEEFVETVNEFWFEVYHVAKYLRREDLWSVKFRSAGIHHGCLLKMIRWNALAKGDWSAHTHPLGKRMKSWAEEKVWKALFGVFAHFSSEDSWISLTCMMDLFRDISQETSVLLEFFYPTEVDERISGFVNQLRP